ncbi:hypothetical protein BC828DRAFT_375663 [Blastocladiella britannica]|nr:hypothetical protein BC828DRAFT_375663 [Blastocladiella britannica]
MKQTTLLLATVLGIACVLLVMVCVYAHQPQTLIPAIIFLALLAAGGVAVARTCSTPAPTSSDAATARIRTADFTPTQQQIECMADPRAWTFHNSNQSPSVHVDQAGTSVQFYPPDIADPFPVKALVQTSLPAPMLALGDSGMSVAPLIYFEVTVAALGSRLRGGRAVPEETRVAVGLGSRPITTCCLPGTYLWSVALDSEHGVLSLRHSSRTSPLTISGRGNNNNNNKLVAGSVIGVEIDTRSRKVTFTVDGKLLNLIVAIPKDVEVVYPSIGADGPCVLEANFGTAPFCASGSASGYSVEALPAYSPV